MALYTEISPSGVTHFSRGYEYAPEHVRATESPRRQLFLCSLLQLKHGQRRTEEVREVVEEYEAVAQRCYGNAGQLTVLHGYV